MKNENSEKALAKINKIWQLSTPLLGSGLITLMFLRFSGQYYFNFFGWLLWFHLPLLMFHEFEEYVLPGGFKSFFNTYTPFSKETPREDNPPINEIMIFIINVGVWIWIIIGALFVKVAPWIGVGAMIFQLINVNGHIYLFQIKKTGYNPGLITTIFLLIPYMVVLTWVSITQNILTPLDWGLAFLIGFIGIGMMLIIGNSSSNKKN